MAMKINFNTHKPNLKTWIFKELNYFKIEHGKRNFELNNLVIYDVETKEEIFTLNNDNLLKSEIRHITFDKEIVQKKEKNLTFKNAHLVNSSKVSFRRLNCVDLYVPSFFFESIENKTKCIPKENKIMGKKFVENDFKINGKEKREIVLLTTNEKTYEVLKESNLELSKESLKNYFEKYFDYQQSKLLQVKNEIFNSLDNNEGFSNYDIYDAFKDFEELKHDERHTWIIHFNKVYNN